MFGSGINNAHRTRQCLIVTVESALDQRLSVEVSQCQSKPHDGHHGSVDRAGQASNAEDFTKQFMSQMYGGQSQQNQQQSNGNSVIKIPNPEQQRWNETRNDAGIKNQFLSSMYGKPTIPTQQAPVQQTIQTPQQSTFQQKPSQVEIYILIFLICN